MDGAVRLTVGRFQEKIQRYAARDRQQLPPGTVPARLAVGEHILARDRTPTHAERSAAASVPVFVQGPRERVEALEAQIATWVAEESAYEREKDHVTTFDFPVKFANYLIGKKGENIRKYREEFDVEIQVHDGKVEIKGPQVKADAAKARIVALGRKLEDETTHVLKIPPQYHRDLIGAKGSQVNRLQDRYHVRVNFPRSTAAGATHDDRSVGDHASEAGPELKHGRGPSAADEVWIRGPRKGADEAKDELLSLLQWTVDHSHSSSVSVARDQIPSLIGQGGREMETLRLATGASIDVPDQKRDGANGAGRAEIRIKGTKKQVDEAKKVLEARAKHFDASVVRTLDVDKRHHKALIGSGGTWTRPVLGAGGHGDEADRRVQAPTYATSWLARAGPTIVASWPGWSASHARTRTTRPSASRDIMRSSTRSSRRWSGSSRSARTRRPRRWPSRRTSIDC